MALRLLLLSKVFQDYYPVFADRPYIGSYLSNVFSDEPKLHDGKPYAGHTHAIVIVGEYFARKNDSYNLEPGFYGISNIPNMMASTLQSNTLLKIRSDILNVKREKKLVLTIVANIIKKTVEEQVLSDDHKANGIVCRMLNHFIY
ncbi:hypothetical protein LIER_14217 [Lithospermum erythrorhizon]|uniref:Uncharacterized protein n=1 Tax=Lithospermum erythrorhizon TaxID=34254 RepID=A0AAV3PYB9_LITER